MPFSLWTCHVHGPVWVMKELHKLPPALSQLVMRLEPSVKHHRLYAYLCASHFIAHCSFTANSSVFWSSVLTVYKVVTTQTGHQAFSCVLHWGVKTKWWKSLKVHSPSYTICSNTIYGREELWSHTLWTSCECRYGIGRHMVVPRNQLPP